MLQAFQRYCPGADVQRVRKRDGVEKRKIRNVLGMHDVSQLHRNAKHVIARRSASSWFKNAEYLEFGEHD